MDERAAYEILGLEPGASPLDVKQAYRRAALATHPDRAPTKASRRQYMKQFLRVRDAYEFLRVNGFPDLPASPESDPAAKLPPLYQAPDWLVAQWEKEARSGWDWPELDEHDVSVLWRLAVVVGFACLFFLGAWSLMKKGVPRKVTIFGVSISPG
ncbi:MAG: DnaJ domain-containing protein [Elusimicrobia bacterium]|nr:DnaJ domain-containing protein [Elusimicrobiota bacterium]